jgi:hypothetical protein
VADRTRLKLEPEPARSPRPMESRKFSSVGHKAAALRIDDRP